MKRGEVDLFIRIYAQIETLYNEIGILSKKNPNDGINKFKLKFINKTLGEANSLLKVEQNPFIDFAFFEEDNLPTNSDVTMILAQYLGYMEELRSANIKEHMENEWWWVIDGKSSQLRTSPPKKLRR